MSGAATNTVAAGPGSLSAVPLLTSSVSVGASVGTTWLWPNGRPAAPPVTTGAGGLAGPAAGGWIGTGAGDGVGAWANCGAGTDGVTATGGDAAPGPYRWSAIRVDAAPTVSITAPANNAVFTPPANIAVTATAADADGTVTKVDFFDGATLVGTATAAPYSVTLANAAGEDERVQAVERGRHRTQLATEPVDEQIDGRLSARQVAREQGAHVARNAGDTE